MKIKTLRLIKTHDGANPLAPDRRTTLEAQAEGVLMVRDGIHRLYPWSNIMFVEVEPPAPKNKGGRPPKAKDASK